VQKSATQGLSKLTHVTINNAGHNLFMVSPEVTKVISLFWSGKALKTNSITVALPKFI